MSIDDEEDAGEGSLFKFSYWIDEERWKRALIDTKGIIRSGVLGSYKKNKIILAVFAVDFAIFICGCIFKINFLIIFLIFISLIFLINLASNNMVNPEKAIKSQWNEGLMHNEDYGKWKVSLSETSVTCDKPKLGRTRMSWKKFLCMVETNTAFYLFLTDKKHFVMILKECIGSHEQMEALKRLCEEKTIAVIMSIKVKYVPYWVFTLLLAVLIFICLFLLACGIII
ncbi:MAG: YcxB family protein, partial [Lachnospiraceae bacterium]|nr:YcxB family protein [Lachnospiraceae bacterium]